MAWKHEVFDAAVTVASLFCRSGPDPRVRPPKEILVLRPGDLGDLLTTTPIFEALRRRFPDTRLIAGVGSWGRFLLENNPFLDEIIPLDMPWSNNFAKESRDAVAQFLFRSPQVMELRRRGGFDVGIDIVGSHYGSALMLRLGVRHRVGVRNYRAGWRACQQYTHYSLETPVPRAALASAELLGAVNLPEPRPQFYPTEAERTEAERLWSEFSPSGSLKLIVGCGSAQAGKCWPPGEFARALREFRMALGPARQLSILILGGAGDRERASRIIADVPLGIRSLCGESSLRVSLALVEQSNLVLTNASMLFHAAAAFYRPTVTVLGPFYVSEYGDGHDRLWGYPPPYSSVGPVNGTWPTVEEVVAKLITASLVQDVEQAHTASLA